MQEDAARGLVYPDGVASARLAGGAGWRVALWRAAGEAGGSFRCLDRPSSGAGSLWDYDPEHSASVAVQRAQAKVRRYCAANLLTRLGTLTCRGEGCHDPQQVRSDLGRFFRRLRRGLGGEALAYVWVPELHPGGHGFHAHFAVGRYVPRGLIEDAWGLGFIKIRLHGDLSVGSGARQEARCSARYLSKYVGKTFRAGCGLNRYDVAQGFQPQAEPVIARTVEEAIEEASERMGGPPEIVFRPDHQEGFRGPPLVWMQWP
jgi:hypothetical protein